MSLCPEYGDGAFGVTLTCDRPYLHRAAHHDPSTGADWWEMCQHCQGTNGLHRSPCRVEDGVLIPPTNPAVGMNDRSPYPPSAERDYEDNSDVVTCQGCGAVRGISWLGKAHNCWRNEDGTYEEGGTFQ